MPSVTIFVLLCFDSNNSVRRSRRINVLFFYRLVPKWTLESVVNTPFIYHNHQGMLWEKVWFISVCMKYYIHIEKYTFELNQLGSVAGPVIQANGRLSFEDDLRSGDLLYYVSQ